MSDAATWQRLLDDDDALKKADPAWLAEQRERWPWFTATPWLQARREVLLQGHSTEATLRQAAAWSGERARLKAWLSGSLRMPMAMPPLELAAAAAPVSAQDASVTLPDTATAAEVAAAPSEEVAAPAEVAAAPSGEADNTTVAEVPEPDSVEVPQQAADVTDTDSRPQADSGTREGEQGSTKASVETPDSSADLPEAPTTSDPVEAVKQPVDSPEAGEVAPREAITAKSNTPDSDTSDSEEAHAQPDFPATTAEADFSQSPAILAGIAAPSDEREETFMPEESSSSVESSADDRKESPADPAEAAEPFSPEEGERHGFSDWLRRFHAAEPIQTASVPQPPNPAPSARLSSRESSREPSREPSRPSSSQPSANPAEKQKAQDSDPTAANSPRFEATEDFEALDGLIARQRRRTAASRARENTSAPHVPAGEEDFPGPLTETWARILADQGKTPEAIAVYEALGLRQPEKSAFFAARIQELKAR